MFSDKCFRRRAVAAAATLIALAGCRDTSVTPPTGLKPGDASRTLRGDVVTAAFTYDPGSGVTATIGSHKIKIPAGTVCDPAVSSYGPTSWDQPCVAATQPITIQATSSLNANGHPFIQFTPALRFVPNGAGKVVTLYMFDKTAAYDPSTRILYCNDVTTLCVNEALTDPSVAPVFDSPNGFVIRRLKHFSGYNMAAGREDDSYLGY